MGSPPAPASTPVRWRPVIKRRILRLLKSTANLVVFIGICVGAWYAYNYYLMPPEEEEGFGELPTAVAEVRDITVSVSATGVLQRSVVPQVALPRLRGLQ